MAAQDLSQIIQELDASYNPSRQSINDRINNLQGAEAADLQGLQGQQKYAFDDILNGARERGVGAGGIPQGEQAQYVSRTFLPAVAKLKSDYVQQRGGLSDALNQLTLDQGKTAQSIRQTQLDRDFQSQEAEKQRQAELAAQRASQTSSDAFASLLNGGSAAQVNNNDPYNTVNKDGANTAIKQLLSSGNAQLVSNTINAINRSAANGNLYDKYKLDLIQSLAGNSAYGSVINKAYQLSAKSGGGATF